MKTISLIVLHLIISINIYSQTTREIFAAKDQLQSDSEPTEYYVASQFFSGNHRIILYSYVKAFSMTDLTWLEDNHKHYREDYEGHKLQNTNIVMADNFKKWKKEQKNAEFVEKLNLDYTRLGNLDTVNLAKLPFYFWSTTDSVHTETINYDNGDVYVGQIIYGIRNGKGKYTWADSTYYEGEYVHDKRTGEGKMTYKDYYYVGTFKNGERHGKGKIYYANGDTFEGFFIKGNRVGSGVYTFKDGSIQKGIWKWDTYIDNSESKYNANEIFIEPYKAKELSEDKYEGSTKNGQRNGYGKYYFKSGQIYEGNFLDGNYHGYGKLIYNDGSWCEGNWFNDERSGEFKYYEYDSTLTFEGIYLNNEKNGKGTEYFAGGDIYIGEYKDDLKSGKGKYIYKTGGSYEGDWANDKYNGIGIFINKDGVKSKGKYVDNICVEVIE